jgi:Ca2+-binding EF-hand superfamily protein
VVFVGDGRITAKELNHVLADLGIPMHKREIKKMIRELDKDGNGTIGKQTKLNYLHFNRQVMR